MMFTALSLALGLNLAGSGACFDAAVFDRVGQDTQGQWHETGEVIGDNGQVYRVEAWTDRTYDADAKTILTAFDAKRDGTPDSLYVESCAEAGFLGAPKGSDEAELSRIVQFSEVGEGWVLIKRREGDNGAETVLLAFNGTQFEREISSDDRGTFVKLLYVPRD